MTPAGVKEVFAGELALRLSALRGTAAYAAYLVPLPDLESVLVDLEDELRAVTSDASVQRLVPHDAVELIAQLAAIPVEVVVVDAHGFSNPEWTAIDHRRSSISHRGVLVFVTTPESFDELMRGAPNLASWLGGEVFAHPKTDARAAADREQRLDALRAWSQKADEEIVEAARAGTLPRDPDYAEWLVLLGRSDLLDSGMP